MIPRYGKESKERDIIDLFNDSYHEHISSSFLFSHPPIRADDWGNVSIVGQSFLGFYLHFLSAVVMVCRGERVTEEEDDDDDRQGRPTGTARFLAAIF